jgi:hypothetical protein
MVGLFLLKRLDFLEKKRGIEIVPASEKPFSSSIFIAFLDTQLNSNAL